MKKSNPLASITNCLDLLRSGAVWHRVAQDNDGQYYWNIKKKIFFLSLKGLCWVPNTPCSFYSPSKTYNKETFQFRKFFLARMNRYLMIFGRNQRIRLYPKPKNVFPLVCSFLGLSQECVQLCAVL